jgi:hypothetical protein
MRSSERGVFYLVGTPRSKMPQYEKKWLDLPWQKAGGGHVPRFDPTLLGQRFNTVARKGHPYRMSVG